MRKLSGNAWGSFCRGARFGLPIALGYFACSIALGILAAQIGLTGGQATLTSALLMASAGEYAFFTAVGEGAGLLEIALTELVANARYFLMSCALGPKLDEKMPIAGRCVIGLTVTDELFGVSVSQAEKVTLSFYLGMMAVAIPGWSAGTLLGAVLGDVLPEAAVTALGMGLYGMFLSTVIPAGKHSRVLLLTVGVSMLASLAMALLPVVSYRNSGTKTVILTVVLAAVFAVLFPVKEEADV